MFLETAKTKRAIAFYAVLGVVCRRVWMHGLDAWSVLLLGLLTGIGSLAAWIEAIRPTKLE